MHKTKNNSADSSPAELPRLLKIDDVADVLGVSVQTVRAWERKGRIQAVRFEGGLLRFAPETIRALIRSANGARRIPPPEFLAATGRTRRRNAQ